MLPRIDLQIDGFIGYLLQGKNQQIVFMEFKKQTIIPEHSHESQWEIVLDGSVDVWIDDKKHHYTRGDRFYIATQVPHRAEVPAGYKAIACFNEPQRYKPLKD
jgi:quercetin dioxygenase-like cupin family protein